jgi:hypothetical protein
LPTNDLRQPQQASAAKSDAVGFEALMVMLAALSPEDRARLAAMLTGQGHGG